MFSARLQSHTYLRRSEWVHAVYSDGWVTRDSTAPEIPVTNNHLPHQNLKLEKLRYIEKIQEELVNEISSQAYASRV